MPHGLLSTPRTAATATIGVARLSAADEALLELGRQMLTGGYRFTCVTPDTHAIVDARRGHAQASDLRDIFGWSLPFDQRLLSADWLALMRQAGVLEQREGGLCGSAVRYASFDRTIVVHSAWPTAQNDAVFFGPDTYRFGALIERVLGERGSAPPRTVVDIGCGTGAGGILAARLLGSASATRVLFTDINRKALAYAAINAQLAGLKAYACCKSDVLQQVEDPVDLVIANPPYMFDPQERAYRHGGGALGSALSVRILGESLQRLAPGGCLILYTASPIVAGIDTLWQACKPLLDKAGVRHDYREIDPDVFGSELHTPAYAEVERIAAVGLVVHIS